VTTQDDSPTAPRQRWTLRRWVTFVAAVAAALAVLAIAGGATGIFRLTDARERLADQLDPATKLAGELSASMINQETGVRGYALSRQPDFLEPYTEGRASEQTAVTNLRQVIAGAYPEATANLDAVVAAAARWQARYAEPTIAAVGAGQAPGGAELAAAGKSLFDDLRASLTVQESYLEGLRSESRQQLADAARGLEAIASGIGLALVIGLVGLTIGLRRGVTRPVQTLVGQVRTVAAGDFDRPVRGAGPAELVELARDVDVMRERILAELSAVQSAHARLDAQARELQRSNSELEQFAYVASHDLQEPLRKVASFCQLLTERYRDTLDDRAKQYIDFAVDGSVRMQSLINDLLAFSRVGRLRGESRDVDAGDLARVAVGNLATAIDEAGAEVTVGPMPTLRLDATLFTTALQNLVGNAVKFRRDGVAPQVRLTATEEGDHWLLTCQDNGIGIDPVYADRIFTIFQRLHPRDVYTGTGIGLAMVRKIIEYHGGRIWLDPDASAEGVGSTFRISLPKDPPSELTERPTP
jgi:signal transduction histidine kinase